VYPKVRNIFLWLYPTMRNIFCIPLCGKFYVAVSNKKEHFYVTLSNYWEHYCLSYSAEHFSVAVSDNEEHFLYPTVWKVLCGCVQ